MLNFVAVNVILDGVGVPLKLFVYLNICSPVTVTYSALEPLAPVFVLDHENFFVNDLPSALIIISNEPTSANDVPVFALIVIVSVVFDSVKPFTVGKVPIVNAKLLLPLYAKMLVVVVCAFVTLPVSSATNVKFSFVKNTVYPSSPSAPLKPFLDLDHENVFSKVIPSTITGILNVPVSAKDIPLLTTMVTAFPLLLNDNPVTVGKVPIVGVIDVLPLYAMATVVIVIAFSIFPS